MILVNNPKTGMSVPSYVVTYRTACII